MKRIVSFITALTFIISSVGFAQDPYSDSRVNHLSPPLTLSDIADGTPHHKNIVLAEIVLSGLIGSIAKLEEIRGTDDLSLVKGAFRKSRDLLERFNKGLENTNFNPASIHADVDSEHIVQLEHNGKKSHIFAITVTVNKKGTPHTYRLLFSTNPVKTERGEVYPTFFCEDKEFDEHRGQIALSDSLPKRGDADKLAMEAYREQEEYDRDVVEWAHKTNRARKATNGMYLGEIVRSLRINASIERRSLTQINHELWIVPLDEEVQDRIEKHQVWVNLKDGSRVKVPAYAHSSNGAIHLFLPKWVADKIPCDNIDSSIPLEPSASEQAAFDYTVKALSHEVGVIFGCPVLRVDDNRPINEIDERLEQSRKSLPKSYQVVDLDRNLKTRDYAASQGTFGPNEYAISDGLRQQILFVLADTVPDARIRPQRFVIRRMGGDQFLVKGPDGKEYPFIYDEHGEGGVRLAVDAKAKPRGFAGKAGMNPKDAWDVIQYSPTIQGALAINGYFTTSDYLEGFDEVAQALFNTTERPSYSSVLSDLKGLQRGVLSIKGHRPYLHKAKKGRDNRYSLTPYGKQMMRTHFQPERLRNTTVSVHAGRLVKMQVFPYRVTIRIPGRPQIQVDANNTAELEIGLNNKLGYLGVRTNASTGGKMLQISRRLSQGRRITEDVQIAYPAILARRLAMVLLPNDIVAAADTAAQSHAADGRFKRRPGKSPEDALKLIAIAPALQGGEGWFTVSEYLNTFSALHNKLGFEAPAENARPTAVNDLSGLVAQGLLEPYDQGEANDTFRLTAAGREACLQILSDPSIFELIQFVGLDEGRSTRLTNALGSAGIDNMSGLKEKTEKDLLAYRQIGKTFSRAIKDTLARYGLELASAKPLTPQDSIDGLGLSKLTAHILKLYGLATIGRLTECTKQCLINLGLVSYGGENERAAEAVSRKLEKRGFKLADTWTPRPGDPIRFLGISERAANALEAIVDVHADATIGWLISKTREELKYIRNLGKTSLDNIEDRLHDNGLSLATAGAVQAPRISLGTNIKDLNFVNCKQPRRIIDNLGRGGITTVDQLIRKTEDEVRAIPRIGDAAFRTVKDTLASYGLKLAEPITDEALRLGVIRAVEAANVSPALVEATVGLARIVRLYDGTYLVENGITAGAIVTAKPDGGYDVRAITSAAAAAQRRLDPKIVNNVIYAVYNTGDDYPLGKVDVVLNRETGETVKHEIVIPKGITIDFQETKRAFPGIVDFYAKAAGVMVVGSRFIVKGEGLGQDAINARIADFNHGISEFVHAHELGHEFYKNIFTPALREKFDNMGMRKRFADIFAKLVLNIPLSKDDDRDLKVITGEIGREGLVKIDGYEVFDEIFNQRTITYKTEDTTHNLITRLSSIGIKIDLADLQLNAIRAHPDPKIRERFEQALSDGRLIPMSADMTGGAPSDRELAGDEKLEKLMIYAEARGLEKPAVRLSANGYKVVEITPGECYRIVPPSRNFAGFLIREGDKWIFQKGRFVTQRVPATAATTRPAVSPDEARKLHEMYRPEGAATGDGEEEAFVPVRAEALDAATRDLLKQAQDALPVTYNEAKPVAYKALGQALAEARAMPLTAPQAEPLAELDTNSVLIFSESLAFGEGMAIFLPRLRTLAESGIRVEVVTTDDRRRRLIDEMNEGKPENQGIVCIASVAQHMAAAEGERRYYFKTDLDPIETGVYNISVIAQKIIEVLGRVCGFAERAEEMEKMRTAARLFKQAA